MSFFDDFDWGGVVKSVVSAAPGIIASTAGARVQAKANQQATAIAQDASVQNEALIREQMNKGTAVRAPAIAHYRTVMGQDPNVLTPQQSIALADSQRMLGNKNMLGQSGGRAFSRMFADTTGRINANAVQENTARRDVAAGQVATMATQEGSLPAANMLVANNNNAAEVAAQNATASGVTNSDTYGQIAQMFANVTKDKDRESRYSEYKTTRS